MKQKLVSVVMPSYNHAQYVGRAIESVLRQTYKNFEFIIADDGSTDGSAEVISRYNDPRIKFTLFKENTSFGAGEYIYEQARGEYIACICSDDMWDETLLEKYVSFLEEHEEYGCCVCQPEVIDENDQKVTNSIYNDLFIGENNTSGWWFKRLYMNGNCICGPSMGIRRTVYEKLGPFRFQYRQLQDYEFWMRLVQISNIYIYPEKLVKYRIHETGENKNMSTPVPEVIIRDHMERKYMMFDVMEQVTEDFFIKAFGDNLILQPGTEGFCVECEKFAIMLDSSIVPVHAAVFYYFRHYNERKFRTCLEEYYHVRRSDFWNLTGADHDMIYENIKNKNLAMDLSNKIGALKDEILQKDKEISRLKRELEKQVL